MIKRSMLVSILVFSISTDSTAAIQTKTIQVIDNPFSATVSLYTFETRFENLDPANTNKYTSARIRSRESRVKLLQDLLRITKFFQETFSDEFTDEQRKKIDDLQHKIDACIADHLKK